MDFILLEISLLNIKEHNYKKYPYLQNTYYGYARLVFQIILSKANLFSNTETWMSALNDRILVFMRQHRIKHNGNKIFCLQDFVTSLNQGSFPVHEGCLKENSSNLCLVAMFNVTSF